MSNHTTGYRAGKRVYDPYVISHVWASGQIPKGVRIDTGSRGNVFATRETIYSYGHHFPMAHRIERADGSVLFAVNDDRHSITTAKHQSRVRAAVSGTECVYVPCAVLKYVIHGGTAVQVAEVFAERVRQYAYPLSEGKRYAGRSRDVAKWATLYGQWTALHAAMGYRCALSRVPAPGTDMSKELASIARKEAREAKARAAERAARERAEAPERLKLVEAWRKGGPDRAMHDGYTIHLTPSGGLDLLRYVDDYVETSQRVTIAADAVRAILAKLPSDLAAYAAEVCPKATGVAVGHWGELSIVADDAGAPCFRVGCHRFAVGEVQDIARALAESDAAA